MFTCDVVACLEQVLVFNWFVVCCLETILLPALKMACEAKSGIVGVCADEQFSDVMCRCYLQGYENSRYLSIL